MLKDYIAYNVKKTRQAQNGVTYAKAYVTKPRLNYSFSSSRNGL